MSVYYTPRKKSRHCQHAELKESSTYGSWKQREKKMACGSFAQTLATLACHSLLQAHSELAPVGVDLVEPFLGHGHLPAVPQVGLELQELDGGGGAERGGGWVG